MSLNQNTHDVDAVLDSETPFGAGLTFAEVRQGKWSQEEDDMLQAAILKHGEKQWRKISDEIMGRSAIQCLHRWTKILKPGLVKGPWTIEEDERLTKWVMTEGATKWAQASIFIKGRNGKQCRERWFNNLNPALKKDPWSEAEDEIIFKLYQTVGSCWSKIAKALPGRTENSIKNRFYSTIRKLATSKKKAAEVEPETTPENPLCQIAPVNHLYKLLADKSIEVKKPAENQTKEKRKRRNKNKRLQAAAQAKLAKSKAITIVESEEEYYPTVSFVEAKQTEEVPENQQVVNNNSTVHNLQNVSMDEKMSVLLEKLASLESMLYNTRKELVSLERSMTDEEIKSYQTMQNQKPQDYQVQQQDQFDRFDDFYGFAPQKHSKMEEECLLHDDMNNSQIFNMYDDYLINFH